MSAAPARWMSGLLKRADVTVTDADVITLEVSLDGERKRLRSLLAEHAAIMEERDAIHEQGERERVKLEAKFAANSERITQIRNQIEATFDRMNGSLAPDGLEIMIKGGEQ